MHPDDRYPEENPYAAPEADLAEEEPVEDGALLAHPRAVAASRGWSWCREGLRLFRRAPLVWTGVTGLVFLLKGSLGLIPFLGAVAVWLLMGVLDAGLMLGARDQFRGGRLRVRYVARGFHRRVGALVGAGVLCGLGVVAISATVSVLFGLPFFFSGSHFDPRTVGRAQLATQILLPGLVGTALWLPILMAWWFAPTLLAFHDEVDVFRALRLSFSGCARNVLPFLVWSGSLLAIAMLYFVLAIFLTMPVTILVPTAIGDGSAASGLVGMVVAVLPTLLAMAAMVALFYTSSYAAYRDLFLARGSGQE